MLLICCVFLSKYWNFEIVPETLLTLQSKGTCFASFQFREFRSRAINILPKFTWTFVPSPLFLPPTIYCIWLELETLYFLVKYLLRKVKSLKWVQGRGERKASKRETKVNETFFSIETAEGIQRYLENPNGTRLFTRPKEVKLFALLFRLKNHCFKILGDLLGILGKPKCFSAEKKNASLPTNRLHFDVTANLKNFIHIIYYL